MLKEFKEKEFERLSNLIDSYVSDIDELTKQIEAVAEKYQKLAEEETKNLSEAVEYYTEQLNNFYHRRDELKLELPEEKKEEVAPIQEEKVVDTIYPENNDTPVEVKEEDVIVEESSDNSSEDTESTDKTTEEWPDETPKSEEESDDEGWPEFPQEWK